MPRSSSPPGAGAIATRELCEATGVAFETPGKLLVATSAMELERMASLEARVRENQIPVEHLSADALRALEPNVRGVGGLRRGLSLDLVLDNHLRRRCHDFGFGNQRGLRFVGQHRRFRDRAERGVMRRHGLFRSNFGFRRQRLRHRGLGRNRGHLLAQRNPKGHASGEGRQIWRG